jgi:4'-phosphopantetheinyl transferase
MQKIVALGFGESPDPARYARLLEFIDPERRERIGRFRRREDALSCLFGDLLVRAVLIRETGVRNRDLIFSREAGGKPVCRVPGGVHFNLSHSGSGILAAFDDSPVGVDIELIKPLAPGVLEWALSPAESKTMESLAETERLSYFYGIWTLKESWLKASGRGLVDHLSDYSVTAGPAPSQFRISNGKLLDGAYLWLLSGLDSDYRAAICSGRDAAPSPVILETMEGLTEFFLRDSL